MVEEMLMVSISQPTITADSLILEKKPKLDHRTYESNSMPTIRPQLLTVNSFCKGLWTTLQCHARVLGLV